jgi:hypothetical protein
MVTGRWIGNQQWRFDRAPASSGPNVGRRILIVRPVVSATPSAYLFRKRVPVLYLNQPAVRGAVSWVFGKKLWFSPCTIWY